RSLRLNNDSSMILVAPHQESSGTAAPAADLRRGTEQDRDRFGAWIHVSQGAGAQIARPSLPGHHIGGGSGAGRSRYGGGSQGVAPGSAAIDSLLECFGGGQQGVEHCP